jgi:hypothetical protein
MRNFENFTNIHNLVFFVNLSKIIIQVNLSKIIIQFSENRKTFQSLTISGKCGNS